MSETAVEQDGLRKRRPSATKTDSVNVSGEKLNSNKSKECNITLGQRTERYLVAIADKIPAQGRSYIVNAAPTVGKLVDTADDLWHKALPHITTAYYKYVLCSSVNSCTLHDASCQ